MTELPFPEESQAELLRAVEALVELDARIARLIRVLNVELRNDDDLQRILGRTAPGFERGPEHPTEGVGIAPDHGWVEHEELRGLLVVRFDLLKRTVSEWGLDATREIVSMAETELSRHGFAPGADGCTLLRELGLALGDEADLGAQPNGGPQP